MNASLIGIDWGSSNLRAFGFDEHGAVVAMRESAAGVLTISDGDFAGRLRSVTTDLAVRPVPVVMCGMVGSRQGWREAPYVACPASLKQLANKMIPVASESPTWIIPGIQCHDDRNTYDVMRGEETQIAGLASSGQTQTVITPGTHSKWATVEDEHIVQFKTYMTGELYELLRTQSILKHSMPATPADKASNDAFEQGVRRSLDDPALTHALFSVRTKGLFKQIASEDLPNYLSGLLIGAEVAAESRTIERSQQIAILATDALAALYRKALLLAGIGAVQSVEGGVAASRGLWRLWQQREFA